MPVAVPLNQCFLSSLIPISAGTAPAELIAVRDTFLGPALHAAAHMCRVCSSGLAASYLQVSDRSSERHTIASFARRLSTAIDECEFIS